MNHHRRHRISWALLAAFAFAFMLAPARAHALTISPSRLELVGDAGTTVERTLLLVNETEEQETYYPSFSNFEARGDSGEPTFVEATDDLGSWMSTAGPVTLAPGESEEVTLWISVPSGAAPGGHFAAVFWGTTPPSLGGGVSVGARIGVLVLLSVPGEIEESFGLVDFHTANKRWFYTSLPVGFEYRFSNQGGDRVKPVASITVRSALGWRVKQLDANPFEGNVLPNTTRKFAPEWAKQESVAEMVAEAEGGYSFTKALAREWHNFAVGVFRANLSVEFGTEENRTTSTAVWFVVFPWELLIVLLPGAYLAFVTLRFLLRRYNRSVIRRAHARFAANKE